MKETTDSALTPESLPTARTCLFPLLVPEGTRKEVAITPFESAVTALTNLPSK
jgi:hypothetical protein